MVYFGYYFFLFCYFWNTLYTNYRGVPIFLFTLINSGVGIWLYALMISLINFTLGQEAIPVTLFQLVTGI